jgi:cyclic di-GMP phosphodiesterase
MILTTQDPTVKSGVTPAPALRTPTAARVPLSASLRQAKVMVVDDEPTNIKVVQRLLQLAGYANFVTTTDSTAALGLIRKEKPDVVLLDLMMPNVSGLEILAEIRSDDKLSFLPVIILTAAADRETKLQSLELGATDFLGKPLDPSELVARIRNVLSVKAYEDRLLHHSQDLESAVRQRTADLEKSRQDLIHCLARAAEFRDDDTGNHILRVGKFVRLVAEKLGVSEDDAQLLEQASQLHDVGKIGIPDAVLLKPGKLTKEEFTAMQQHCQFGGHILHTGSEPEDEQLQKHTQLGAQILENGSSPILETAVRIALSHHEWWDGTGYPQGLAGEEIPLEGRITAVADVFDALSSKRCYKEAYSLDESLAIMRRERGTHFDPKVLDAFLAEQDKVAEILRSHADEG